MYMKQSNKILSLLLASAMTLSLSLPALAAEGTATDAPKATTSPAPVVSTAPSAEPTAVPSTLPEVSGKPVASAEPSATPEVSAAPEAPKPVYTDLPEKAWYLDAVGYVVEKGVMAGVTADKFAPTENATRGQVFQALYNMAGKPDAGKTTFTDVEGKDYAAAAAWAENAKLTTGTGKGAFSGEKSITRQELAKLFSDYMNLQKMARLQASLSKVTDADAVAAWAKEGMEYAVGAGLIKGTTAGAVNPTGTTTRAELAQMLLNLSQLTPAAAEGAAPAAVESKITAVEKYGNIDLDLLSVNLYAAGYKAGDLLTVTVGDKKLSVPFCTNYSDVDNGALVARDASASSSPYVIIAINMGDFAKTYGCKVGDTVKIALEKAGGYLAEYQAHQVTRTNDRADYASDEMFANFRPIVMGSIAEGVLYRTSSPVNNELGRAAYADKLLETAGVKTVINLADSKELIDGYIAAEGFASPIYKGLYEANQVVALNMGVDSSSDDFKAKLKTGLEFMIAHEGPYAFHCTEGKDRAGFMSILLESLMGGKRDEIVADYMTSFVNYYHVEKDSDQYKTISAIADGILCQLAGLEKGSDLSKVDLKKAATEYLTGIGMTKDQVAALEKVLSTPVAAEKPAADTSDKTETGKAA